METKKAIYQWKPEKFNEICSLNDAELNQELKYKEQLLRLSNYKETTIERVESCESLNTLLDNETSNLENSKKFGSLDSLSSKY